MNAAPDLLTPPAQSAVIRRWRGTRMAIVLLGAIAASACTTTARQLGDAHPISQTVGTHTTPAVDEERELRVAQTALQGGDLDMATGIYGRLLQQKPQSVPALTGLGDTLYAVGDYTRADVYYRKAVALDAKAVPALIGMARVAIQQRHFDRAVTTYRQVLAIQPGQTLAAAGLGAALDMLGDHAGAQMSMRTALDANPGDIGLSINLGLSLVMDGKLQEGADMLLDVTRFPGAPPQARYDLALAYGLLGDDEEAARLLSDLPKQAVEDNLRYYATLRERHVSAAVPVPVVAAAPVLATAPRAVVAQPAVAPVATPSVRQSTIPAAPAAAVRAPSPMRVAAAQPMVQTDPGMADGGVISGRLTNGSSSPFDDPRASQPARLASQSAPVLP